MAVHNTIRIGIHAATGARSTTYSANGLMRMSDIILREMGFELDHGERFRIIEGGLRVWLLHQQLLELSIEVFDAAGKTEMVWPMEIVYSNDPAPAGQEPLVGKFIEVRKIIRGKLEKLQTRTNAHTYRFYAKTTEGAHRVAGWAIGAPADRSGLTKETIAENFISTTNICGSLFLHSKHT